MQIRPTAFTIGLIIHPSIALFCVYTEFGIDSIQSWFSDRNGDSISVCSISDNQFFYGQLLRLPDFADRVYHDDGGSAQ